MIPHLESAECGPKVGPAHATATVALLLLLVTVCPMLTAAQFPQATVDRQPENELYYFVIDKSGSIVQNRLVDPIRGAVVDFVGRRSPETHVEVVFFSDTATKGRKWTSMDLSAKGDFTRFFFENFKPSGETRLYDTVGEVIARVAVEVGRYRQISVIILSDGDDTKSTRYRGWSALCDLCTQLKIDPKTTSFSWYTLGYEPKDKPYPSCLIKHYSVPNPVQIQIIEPPPQADFTAHPMKVRVGEPVLFTPDKEVGISKVRWDFGDGTTSTDLKPRHSYQRNGRFDVILAVEGPGGKAESKPGACVIEVMEQVPLEAKFKWVPKVVRAGEEVTFVDESLGGPESWEWRVQGINPKTERSPTFVFNREGAVSVQLVITKEGKTSTATQVIDVLPQPPNAGFSVEPLEPEVGSVLKLRADTNNPAWHHQWTVAGIVLPETRAEAQWKVDRAGRIDIVHSVEGPGGLKEQEKAVFAVEPLVAKFSWVPPAPRVGDTVYFQDESTGDPNTLEWDIPAVGKQVGRQVSMTFTNEGDFVIKLSVAKPGRAAATTNRVVKVLPQLIKLDASFSCTPAVFTIGTTVRLTALHDGPGWEHEWFIGEGVRLTGPTVTCTPTNIGEIVAVHRVTSPDGTDSKTNILLGKLDIPLAKFSAAPVSGKSPLTVRFKNESRGEIVEYNWDFGDGNSSSDKEPVHTYQLPGSSKQVFKPILTVKNRTGDTSKNTDPVTIVVEPPPPWWKTWRLGVVVVVVIGTYWLGNKFLPRKLYGTLRWSYGGKSDVKSLSECGRSFDLSELKLDPLQGKQGEYVIRRTRDEGMHLRRRFDEPLALMHRTKFQVEGIDFEYLES